MGVDQINGVLPKTPSKLKRSFQIVPLSRAPAQRKHVDFNPGLPERFNLRFHKRSDGRTFRGGINRRDNQFFHPNSALDVLALRLPRGPRENAVARTSGFTKAIYGNQKAGE